MEKNSSSVERKKAAPVKEKPMGLSKITKETIIEDFETGKKELDHLIVENKEAEEMPVLPQEKSASTGANSSEQDSQNDFKTFETDEDDFFGKNSMVSKKAFSSEAAPKIILLDEKKAKNDGAQHLKMDQKQIAPKKEEKIISAPQKMMPKTVNFEQKTESKPTPEIISSHQNQEKSPIEEEIPPIEEEISPIEEEVSNVATEKQQLTHMTAKSEYIEREQQEESDETVLSPAMLEFIKEASEENGYDLKNYEPTEEFHKLLEQVESKAINIIPFSALNSSRKLLGEGGFGEVYKGKWTTRDVAIKEMTLSYEEFRTMDSEMTFMAKERHPTLVSMYGVALQEVRQNRLHCCIVMELMEFDLDYFIFEDNCNKKTLKQKTEILRDVAEGVSFLHGQGVVHRDLKPKNVLLDAKLSAKLTDLGIARVLENKEQTQGCTIAFTARYASRETVVDEITSFASDIWSLGLLVFEVLSEQRAWADKTPNKIIISLSSKQDPFGGKLSELVKDEGLEKLVAKCCDYEPEKRPKALEVFEMFSEIYNRL